MPTAMFSRRCHSQHPNIPLCAPYPQYQGMCSHYQGLQQPRTCREVFQVEPPPHAGKENMWPCYQGCFIRRHPQAQVGDEAVPAREALIGQFGLAPGAPLHHPGPGPLRARLAQRQGRCLPHLPHRWPSLGIAGLWERWNAPEGETVHSFTMLTIHAGPHPLVQLFHQPGDAKHMVAIPPEAQFDDWLDAPAHHSMAFLQPYPAEGSRAGWVTGVGPITLQCFPKAAMQGQFQHDPRQKNLYTHC